MLLDLLAGYLNDVESAVQGLKDAYIEFYEEEIIASDRINLRIPLRFSSGYLLELNESVVAEGEIKHLGYRYHFQDEQNNLVFRYDNTPHFRDLEADLDKVRCFHLQTHRRLHPLRKQAGAVP